MDRGRTPGQETRPTRDNGSKRAAGSGDPAYKGSSSGETPAAAGSGRSEPWRRTNPIPRAAARKLILPRASSASVGTVPRSAPTTNPTHPHPLMDRGRTPGQETRPTRDNGPKPDAGSGDPAYKGSFSGATRAAAGSGRSEPWRRTPKIPRAQRESSSSPEPPQRAQARSRGAPTRPSQLMTQKPSVYASKESPKVNTKSATSGVPTWKTFRQR
jgi:hypothetical protein